MKKPAPKRIPDDHHIVRHASWTKLRRDEDDNVIGVRGDAFKLRGATPEREAEEYLSTTWLQYFAGERAEKISRAIRAVRASNLTVKPKSGFAIGNVAEIAAVCGRKGHQIRVVLEPEDDNKAHTAVRRFPDNDDDLLEELAVTAWSEVVLNSSVPAGEEAAPDAPVEEI